MNTQQQELAAINARLDQLASQMEVLLRAQAFNRDIVDEFSPIAKEVMGVGASRLAEAEERGYFVFGKHILRIVNTIIDNYNDDDLQQLGDNVIYMIDTLRSFTQPNVLKIANEATAALQDDTGEAPKSLLGMLKASRNEDVRRGMAVALNVMKYIGRAAKDARPPRSPRMRRLENRLAPTLRYAPKAAPAAPAPKAAPAATKASSSADVQIPGYDMTPDGFLMNLEDWNEGYAKAVAQTVGYALTDAHWALIAWIQQDYRDKGASPNVRRIGKNSPSSTKELYAMFPSAPALEAARLAGIPKPVGCI